MLPSYMFKLGDVVTLKSGGPLMTVIGRELNEVNEPEPVALYQVAAITASGPIVLVVPGAALQRPA